MRWFNSRLYKEYFLYDRYCYIIDNAFLNNNSLESLNFIITTTIILLFF